MKVRTTMVRKQEDYSVVMYKGRECAKHYNGGTNTVSNYSQT